MSLKHHDQTPSVQKLFVNNVKSLVAVINDMGNPFTDDSGDLYVLDSKVVMDKSVAESLSTIYDTGLAKYTEYVMCCLEDCSTPITNTLKKNNFSLFNTIVKSKLSSKSRAQISSLKAESALFSRLYISCQYRESDLIQFFSHENQATPPSLSSLGVLRQCTKSDLLKCFDKSSDLVAATAPKVDAKMID